MAKRKGKKRTRRRKTGVSLLGLAETFALANVATQTLFKSNPVTFIAGNTRGGTASGADSLSIMEIFGQLSSANTSSFPMKIIRKNLAANWVTGVAGMVLIPIGFRVGKALARPAISKTNRLLGKVGISKTVKV